MSTYELTEFAELPTKQGSKVPVGSVPHLQHRVLIVGPGNEVQLDSRTRYIILDRASVDLRYKFGLASADVTGANAPTAATARQLKTTDQPHDYQTPGSLWLATV